MRVAHHVELEPPEIVVVRLHATRLAAEGLRASMRPAEPAAGRKQGASPGDAPWTRVVVVIGADDVNPEASVNFAAVWAFAPRPDSRACRTGTVDAWWSSEGTAVLSFGRRGRISETPGGGATWQTLEAADREGPLAQAGMGRGGVRYTEAERRLMGLGGVRDEANEPVAQIRWLAEGADSGRGPSTGATVCGFRRDSLTRLSRKPGVGPSMRLVVVSSSELSAQERARHLTWWREYTAADRDSRPEVTNFFEASGQTAAPAALPEPRLNRACGRIAADLP